MDAKVQELLERGVAALEKLSDDPVIHMETGPLGRKLCLDK